MTALVHGTVVAIGGKAVMIIGTPGSGKSDLAFRLIDRGAVLVADDYVEIVPSGDVLFCSPPDAIAGRLEVRGVGIAILPFVSGVPLALVVDLDHGPERLPHRSTRNVSGIDVASIALTAREASAPLKVELALSGKLVALD